MTLKDFLTYRLYEKYKEILPVIDLVMYYASYDLYNELFTYDGLSPEKKPTAKQQIDEISGICEYYLHKFKSFLSIKRKTGKMKVLCSDTILLLDRYRGFVDSLSNECDIYSVMRYGDYRWTLRKNNNLLANQKKTFYGIYIGKNVEGPRLKRLVRELYILFVELYDKKQTCIDVYEKVELLLCLIQKQVRNRINRTKRQIKKSNVDMFITINQQRLKDVICIMACQELKIWTKEISHFSSFSYFQKPVRYAVLEHRKDIMTMYVDESCQWSAWDKESMKIRNVYDLPMKISVVGCVELSEEEVQRNIENQKRENIIVFFTLNELVECDMESHLMCGKDFKIVVYEKLAKLANIYDYKVVVRHHPSIPLKEYEHSLIEQYKFSVCPNTSNDLNKLLCKAKIAIGGGSSSLIKAKYCGLQCFNIIDQNDKEKNKRANITFIDWKSIDQIVIDNDLEIVVNYDEFINIEKVLRIPKKCKKIDNREDII